MLQPRVRTKSFNARGSQACSKNRKTPFKKLDGKHKSKSTIASADNDDAAIARNASAESAAPKQE